MPDKLTTLKLIDNTEVFPNTKDKNIPDTIMRIADLSKYVNLLTHVNINGYIHSITITSDIATFTTADISTLNVSGISHFEGKSTFESDVKAKGKLIVNSADDITDKDGNAIVKNESLEEFKKKFFRNMGIARFAGTTFKDEQPNEDEFSTLWTRISQYASGSKMETYAGKLNDIYRLPDFGNVDACFNMIQDIPNSEILFGNLTLSQYCGEWFWFSNNLAQKILIGEGKKVIINSHKSYYTFYKCPNLEEIGEFDFSGVTLIIDNLITSSPKVKHIHIKHFKVSFDISPSTAFEQSDLVEIISNLDPVSTPQTLTMGATNLAKLTQDQILVATGKGWTLA